MDSGQWTVDSGQWTERCDDNLILIFAFHCSGRSFNKKESDIKKITSKYPIPFVYFSFTVNSVSDVLYKIICPRLSVHCPLTTVHFFLISS